MTSATLAPRLPIFAQRRRSRLLTLEPDDRLVALARDGHEAAFEVLVERYDKRLHVFCRNMLRSAEDARDMVQDVFANAHRAMLADERPIHVKAWLYRIARNRCLNHLRRPQPEGVDTMDVFEGAVASAADTAGSREDLQLLVRDVQSLPETQRTALVLREMEALSYDQIATVLEKSVPAVKSLLVRARVSLAEKAMDRTA
ncbi:MAG TPA: RNA polymerase sigma factor [Thermoleophilaceae bacterium]|jgi:RNA polymerase sigma factor (sigma-70 family)|nr:RNA polymerase sigma factor [Thermoleophilaceae bacterium]